MVDDYKILDNISNAYVVEDYLISERIAKRNNKSLVHSIAVASILVCGTNNLEALPIKPNIYNEFDNSKTAQVKRQSDYLDYYIQEVNQLTTPLVIKEDLIEEILSFKSLKQNWDGYGAVPVEVKSASNTIKILDKISTSGISKINEIYPNTHGTVTVEFENYNSEKLSLEIGNESFAYYIELNSLNVCFYNDLSFSNENIKELIKNIQSI